MTTKIEPEEFRIWARYIKEISGIHLEAVKAYLIETRLAGLLESHGCSTFGELYLKARADGSRAMEKKIIDQMTTNETFFFRDNLPFELLKYKILPDLIDRKMERAVSGLPITIRIWSAGCSTGQEVYSIAISLKELLEDMKRYNIRILGTDISGAAVARASYGMYNRFEVERGLSSDKLGKYFTRNGDNWKIKDEIRAMATFKKENLMTSFMGRGRFEIIFCRNVAIYFNYADRRELFHKISQVIHPDGYLIIGATESLTRIYSGFEPKRYLRSVFYQLKRA